MYSVTVHRNRSERQVSAEPCIDKMVFSVMFHKKHNVCLGAEVLSVMDSAVINGGDDPVSRSKQVQQRIQFIAESAPATTKNLFDQVTPADGIRPVEHDSCVFKWQCLGRKFKALVKIVECNLEIRR